jgi:hypothetical protein
MASDQLVGSNVEEIMTTIAEQVCAQLDGRLKTAEAAVAADTGASTVLGGVVAEFRRKFAKTRSAVEAVQGPTNARQWSNSSKRPTAPNGQHWPIRARPSGPN